MVDSPDGGPGNIIISFHLSTQPESLKIKPTEVKFKYDFLLST